jgi:hypothetical protein
MHKGQLTSLSWVLVALFAIVTLIRGLAPTMVPGSLLSALVLFLPPVFFFVHGSLSYRLKDLLVFAAITLVVSNLFENMSVLTGFPFGKYAYTDTAKPPPDARRARQDRPSHPAAGAATVRPGRAGARPAERSRAAGCSPRKPGRPQYAAAPPPRRRSSCATASASRSTSAACCCACTCCSWCFAPPMPGRARSAACHSMRP